MDRLTAEMGRVREKRRVEERRWEKRKSQKKENADARKGRKVAKHCVFPMICGSGGSKSRLAKAAGAEPLARWEMKKCTPLWREAHLEVKKLKTLHVRTTFGSWDVEQVHAVVARSTFRSQHVKNTRATRGSDHFWTFRCRFAWQAQGIVLCTFSKVSKTWGFCSISKNDGRRGTFEDYLRRCISRGRRSTKDMFIRDVRRSGRWFPKRGCILEHQICRFAKMILRDRCSTSYDLASIFRGMRSTLDRWSGKIAKRIGRRPWALHSTFHFWRKSRRIVPSFILSISKIEEVSQNCFVIDVVKNEEVSQNCFAFDVVKFKNWGSLVELLRFDVVNFAKWRSLAELLLFWRCQVQTLRKSRRIAAFLMLSTKKMRRCRRLAAFLILSSSKPEDVLQNSFVFKLADRQVDR